MRDDEIDDVPERPEEEDLATTLLDRLDSDEELGAPDEPPPAIPSLGRREVDALVDRVLDEELKRVSGSKRTG
jgi:hypothetical protein